MTNNRKYKLFFTILLIPALLFVLDLWVENSSEELYKSVFEPILHFELPGIEIIYALFFIAPLYLIATFILTWKDSELSHNKTLVENQSSEIVELKKQINNKAELLWQNHKELLGIRRDEILSKIFSTFVYAESKVQSVQMYRYSINYTDSEAIIKLNYVTGTSDEFVNINSMAQCYHHISKKMILEFSDNILPILNSSEQCDIDDMISSVTKFIKTYSKSLNTKKIENFNEEDANKYALMYLTLEKLYSTVDKDLRIQLLEKPTREKKLNEFKTGLLRAIFLNDLYLFKYHNSGNGSKKKTDRFYITLPLVYNNSEHIISISFDGEITSSKEAKNIALELHELIRESLVQN
ncbi:MAG: hypothetical protein JEZ08_12665 [Clostridiales bacterium]|nr:hypothetical protein [Clostridiales bacterium]